MICENSSNKQPGNLSLTDFTDEHRTTVLRRLFGSQSQNVDQCVSFSLKRVAQREFEKVFKHLATSFKSECKMKNENRFCFEEYFTFLLLNFLFFIQLGAL